MPAIARWVGALPEGKELALPAITMDWTATFLALAEAKASAPLDGIDLLPWLREPGRAAPERALFWRKDRDGGQRAARRGSWKYLRDGKTELLFDLSGDPGEKRDVAAEHPRRVNELRGELTAWEAAVDRDAPALKSK